MNRVKRWFKHTHLGKMAIAMLHEVECRVLPLIISDEKAVKRYYRGITGKELDLSDPKTFCEKLNWYKLYGKNPLMAQCADKVAMRDYVIQSGYGDHLNDLYGIYTTVKDIDLESLPEQFVIKAAHGSHMNIIVQDKARINWKQAQSLMKSWLRQNIYWSGREWVYKDIPHRLLAEKYMVDESGELRDYKFFCFHGQPYYMQYDMGRYGKKQYRNYYNMQKELVALSDGVESNQSISFPLPEQIFSEMIEMCQKLSAPFQHVRVDFYYARGKIYVGEFTFFDGGGSTVFTPDEWNYLFSEAWKVNNEVKD